jgi:hypothetical protein
MADLTIKQHDTHPPIDAILKAAGVPIDLTTATQVKILAKNATGSVTWSGTCTITSAAGGAVRYVLTGTTDTATVNTYSLEWEITWATGKITTVPNDSYLTLEIKADLG